MLHFHRRQMACSLPDLLQARDNLGRQEEIGIAKSRMKWEDVIGIKRSLAQENSDKVLRRLIYLHPSFKQIKIQLLPSNAKIGQREQDHTEANQKGGR